MPKRVRRIRFRKKHRASSKQKIERKYGIPKMVSSVLGKVQSFTITQEFPITAAFPNTLPGTSSTSVYTLNSATTNGTFAAPIVQVNLFTQLSLSTPGSAGYSGKFKAAVEQYQYMRVRGFKITFINTIPTGSENNNSLVPTLTKTPDLAVTILPADLLSYTGILANIATDRVIPSDIFEYDNTLKVQVNNTSARGVPKYYSVPQIHIAPRDINALTSFGSDNSWNYTQNYVTCMDWNLVIGYESYPQTINNTAAGFVGNTAIGNVYVETLLEFAIPIKNQII